MVDAESKIKSKRIEHCYPRQEVYHRFIHDNEYYYSNKAHAISSKGNYLSFGDIGRNKSVKDIEEYWYPGNRIFAIINRERKKILVSHKYENLAIELLHTIPDDYEILHCNDNIPSPNIFNDENIDGLTKLHLKYCIEQYVERKLIPFYAVCKGKNVLHRNIDDITKNIASNITFCYDYKAIEDFVKKYKVKQRTWYNQSLNSKFKFCIYYPDSWSYIHIALPTVKQILTNKVFNEKQKDLFRKKYFYTKYCRGRGISYKDVDKYFNTPITNDEAVNYCNKNNIYLNPDWLVDVNTWNELISKTKEIEDKIRDKCVKENIAKSDANYKAALEELRRLESNYIVNSWREGTVNNKQHTVTYRKYNRPSRYNKAGSWIIATIHSSCKSFVNTQLKLKNNIIITSKNASVTLKEGIKMYKMFMKARANNPACISWTTSNFGNVKIGIYNLRFITYKDKVTDSGTPLGYKEWCIQIGCHSLWLDDIEDFIRYYHLEDKFHSQTKKNN
ncbi:MAG: hypothetical protein [crAssphage sp. isolate ctcc615]|uniref:Uncharacterized protein n=1 Tax=crAssphage sp. isolate ctcc615 TaxID=2989853 RepID=A0A345BP11_9CAUD|nr:MAG: hypothetical protein KNU00_gp17 [crAssphage sp. isolate ctcc615]AXF52182.1 MAG: hypothetical protein [crAssphage sp. isolate ctcc615]